MKPMAPPTIGYNPRRERESCHGPKMKQMTMRVPMHDTMRTKLLSEPLVRLCTVVTFSARNVVRSPAEFESMSKKLMSCRKKAFMPRLRIKVVRRTPATLKQLTSPVVASTMPRQMHKTKMQLSVASRSMSSGFGRKSTSKKLAMK